MISKMRKASVAGFSLVELMVVVAIIGILAAVAIPNFQRFQRKARQSEAKAVLGGIYSAESAFRSEWESYYGDLADIGYAASGTMRYNAGWAAVITPAVPNYTANALNYTDTNAYCVAVPTDCTMQAVVTAVAAGGATATTFSAEATGMIGGTMVVTDIWSITQLKDLMNTADGTL